MKKYLVYMTCAAAAMIGGTGCSDFGDVNMDPEHLNSENIPTELLFTNCQHQMLGSDWDVWRNGCIYAAQWMSHTASFNWLGNANYTWNDGYSGAYWEIYNGDTRGALRDMKDAVEAWKEDPSRQTDYQIARIGGSDEIGGQLLPRRCLEVAEVCQLTDAAHGDAYVEGRPGRSGAMGEDRGSQRGI